VTDPDKLADSVRREGARRERHRIEGERPLGLNLATIGALGWLFVTPMLAGVLAGRALDRAFSSGIFWTGAFLVVGAALGLRLAWRRMNEMGRDR
jgi:ATP synthase protein I